MFGIVGLSPNHSSCKPIEKLGLNCELTKTWLLVSVLLWTFGNNKTQSLNRLLASIEQRLISLEVTLLSNTKAGKYLR